MNCATGKLFSFATRKEVEPTKAKRKTSQSHLFEDTVTETFSCLMGCGRKFSSEPAMCGHLSHCKRRKKAEAKSGVSQCRAVLDRMGKK